MFRNIVSLKSEDLLAPHPTSHLQDHPFPRCRPGSSRKISRPPGYDPRNIQLVASRYTDYAIPTAHKYGLYMSPNSVGKDITGSQVVFMQNLSYFTYVV
jgi:hypothetical protein